MIMTTETLRKILYVDDDPDIREIVRMSLSTLGSFEVETCESCEDAIGKIDAFEPDLLLLDLMMPGMDGFGTLEALRRKVSAERAPAVFVTAKVEAGDMAGYRDKGAIDVIVKPFDPVSLPGRVKEIWTSFKRGAREPGT